MWAESGTEESVASRWFTWNLSDDGWHTFAARLERRFGAPRDPEKMDEQLRSIPLQDMFQLASGGEWLSWIGPAAAKRCEARAVAVN